jgi:hypothetical protein
MKWIASAHYLSQHGQVELIFDRRCGPAKWLLKELGNTVNSFVVLSIRISAVAWAFTMNSMVRSTLIVFFLYVHTVGVVPGEESRMKDTGNTSIACGPPDSDAIIPALYAPQSRCTHRPV